LAGYQKMHPRKLHFFFDWIVGERRVPSGWHEPLYSIQNEKARLHNSSLHGSKSTSQLNENSAASSNDDLPAASNHTTATHMTTSRSEFHLGAENEPKFPVVIFSHGISGNRLCYSAICASLASYGFVVVALEHRDRSCCWTFALETDPLSGIIIEKPIFMTHYPDGEGDWRRCNKQVVLRLFKSYE
jgi:hypothetical protein